MAVNLRKKASETSKTVFLWLRRYWLTIAAIAIIPGLVVSAEWLYAHTKDDKAFGTFANLLVQGAGLIAVGLILTPLIRRITTRRQQRMDFMYRIREAHVRIANAQRLIYADRSCTIYCEQMRVLMQVTPKLEDIERDIAATTDLFKPRDKTKIQKGINEIVAYLDKGYDQYAEWCNGEDYETLRQREHGWLGELVKCRRNMPAEYGRALDKSKGNNSPLCLRPWKGESGVRAKQDACTPLRRRTPQRREPRFCGRTPRRRLCPRPSACSIEGREAFKESKALANSLPRRANLDRTTDREER